MKFLRAVARLPQQKRQRLPEIVGHVVEGVAALAAEEGAGVDAEFRVKGADAAVCRGVKPGKIDALGHEAVQGGGILPQHPVVHGLHQHQNHVFPGKQASHFVFHRLVFILEISVNLLPPCLVSFGVGRGQGINGVGVDVLAQCLVQAADLIEPVCVEQVLVGGSGGLHPSVVGLGIPNVVILFKYQLGHHSSDGSRRPAQHREHQRPPPAIFPSGELPYHHHPKSDQEYRAQPPFYRVAEHHIGVIRPFGGISEIR